ERLSHISMPTDPRHILIVHVAGLAQTTLALPALRSLRQHLPKSRITVVSSPVAADLLRLAECADEILPVARFRDAEFLNPRKFYRAAKSLRDLRREHFDLAVEFKTGAESGLVLQFVHSRERLTGKKKGVEAALDRLSKAIGHAGAARGHDAHEYLKRLETLGVRPVESEPRIATLRESDERIERLLVKHNVGFGELLIGVHPGAGAGKPRWPIDRFASIAARMTHNFGARVLVFAGPGERGEAKRLAAMLPARSAIAFESPKIIDFVSAAARLSLFVGNHSGPAHVAAAAGAPAVVASTFERPAPQDLLGARVEHVRAPHITLVSEEDVYEAACRLLKSNRAEFLRSR
ncbi:MAG TPA: glycosyltransferase family 9 protein, partial [Blastocatellia bacterium]|nr:glycosyltransferase family 9 protein [Blastocatellia bacterium]